MTDFRPSPIAGTWYPGDREALLRSVTRQLEAVPERPPDGDVIGVIVPHAGHRYSGQVAAHAFRLLQGMQPDILAIVSPMHHPHPARLLTSSHAAYVTPLGPVPVDQAKVDELARAIEAHGGPKPEKVTRDPEHALEIELPFAQVVLAPGFQLLPLMVRDVSPSVVEAAGHGLADVLRGRRALLVASSDLSHFYPDELARQLDSAMLERIERFDPAAVLAAEDEGVGFACGRGAIAAVLWAARDLGADRVRILHYANSGDVTGDMSAVVGYGAAAILRTTPS
jgi:AmmeMemoRadiSam system protein B